MTSRVVAGGGRIARDTRPPGRGPNGRPFCKWCHEEITAPRRYSYCSDACAHEWRLRAEPDYIRQCVFERDKGICAWCGADTVALAAEVRRRKRENWRSAAEWCRKRGLSTHRMSFWDADHILPVSEGGGGCNLSNIRTLCEPCHKRATADLARRIAKRRVAERLLLSESPPEPRPQLALPFFEETVVHSEQS